MIYFMWTFSAEIATFFGLADGDAERIFVKTEQTSAMSASRTSIGWF